MDIKNILKTDKCYVLLFHQIFSNREQLKSLYIFKSCCNTKDKKVVIMYRGALKGGLMMDDITIIELFCKRDERAINELKYKYEKLCYKICRNILRQEQDIEECINDTYLAVWNSIPPESPAHLSSYICKILKNFCINKAKYNSADKRNVEFTISLEELSDCLSSFNDTESVTSAKVLGEMISSFLYTQNETHRKIFVRRYWYSDSIDEIARLYNMNERTIRSVLHRMRKKLKLYLMKEGYFNE